jgi:hypothetical protein
MGFDYISVAFGFFAGLSWGVIIVSFLRPMRRGDETGKR